MYVPRPKWNRPREGEEEGKKPLGCYTGFGPTHSSRNRCSRAAGQVVHEDSISTSDRPVSPKPRMRPMYGSKAHRVQEAQPPTNRVYGGPSGCCATTSHTTYPLSPRQGWQHLLQLKGAAAKTYDPTQLFGKLPYLARLANGANGGRKPTSRSRPFGSRACGNKVELHVPTIRGLSVKYVSKWIPSSFRIAED